MQKHRSFSMITILFFAIILSVLLTWIIRGNNPQTVSVIEGRTLGKFYTAGMDIRRAAGRLYRGKPASALEALQNLIKTRSDQKLIEAAASDQFPLRLTFIKAAKAIDRQVIKLAYLLLPDPAIPADMQSVIYVMRDESALIYAPYLFNEDTPDMIDHQIQNFQTLIDTYPDINFLAYQVEMLNYSAHHPLNPYIPESDNGRSLAYFENNLPEGLSFAKMDLADLDEFMQDFYRTDVHWNINGVIKAYGQIYHLLEQAYPNISPRLEFEEVISVPDIEFLGTMPRASFYPIKGDVLEGVITNLPEYRVYVNGEEIQYDRSQVYYDGQYSKDPYYYHFTEFFGTNLAFQEYVFENNSIRNLLLVGNSFKIPLQPFIAYHYKHTYSINPSLYGKFVLSDFLTQYQIDDVLFLSDNNMLFLDENLSIAP
ncbi:MAG: hypothetical protein MUO40_12215 [Anaerolineaceae bacterium]|nr:hypothetical protein [Anaerolineaceae bacterium]